MIRKFWHKLWGSTQNNIAEIEKKVEHESIINASRIHNFSVGVSQSIGNVRSTNEDAIFSLQLTTINQKHAQSMGLFVIADGMGGHQFGEIASEMAIKAATNHIIENLLLSNSQDQRISEKKSHKNIG